MLSHQVIAQENKEALVQLEKDIDNIILRVSTILDSVSMTEEKGGTEGESLLELVAKYKQISTKTDFDEEEKAALIARLEPLGVIFLIELQQKVTQCSQKAIDANQPRNIQDLNQFMSAFSIFSKKISSENPILEDILDSLKPLVCRPIGLAEALIPRLCGLVLGLINTVLFSIMGSLIGSTGLPSLFLLMAAENLGFWGYAAFFTTLIAPVVAAFFLPFPFIISYLIAFQAINVLLGAVWGITEGLDTYDNMYASSRNLFFFQPPSSHEDIRKDVRKFASNNQGLFKQFLKSDFVHDQLDINNDMRLAEHINIPKDLAGIINSYARDDYERSSNVDRLVGKICSHR